MILDHIEKFFRLWTVTPNRDDNSDSDNHVAADDDAGTSHKDNDDDNNIANVNDDDSHLLSYPPMGSQTFRCTTYYTMFGDTDRLQV
jgi:hypothetical protein